MNFIKKLFNSSCSSCECNLNYSNIPKDKILNNNKIFKYIDHFISKSIFALPAFFILLFLIFELTFTIWWIVSDYIDSFSEYLLNMTWIENIIFVAIWWGVFGLLVYIPNVVILYFFLYFLNDSGILQAFSKRFDKYLQKIWISWKWFLSMFLWFGCTVPAILSTKLIENKKEQIIVVMALPFIPCSAKLPIFVLLISAFIPHKFQSLTLIWLYFIWILFAILSVKFFWKILKHNNCSLKHELVIYTLPSLKQILYQIYDVLWEFVKKVWLFIIPMSMILTLVFYYPNGDIKTSYWANLVKCTQSIFKPLGWNEKMSIAIFPWLIWKEIIVSTLGSLYYIDDVSDNSSLIKKIRQDKTITLPWVISFMLFILIYTSCIGSVITAWRVLWPKWWIVFFLYPILLAYIVSFIAYRMLVNIF